MRLAGISHSEQSSHSPSEREQAEQSLSQRERASRAVTLPARERDREKETERKLALYNSNRASHSVDTVSARISTKTTATTVIIVLTSFLRMRMAGLISNFLPNLDSMFSCGRSYLLSLYHQFVFQEWKEFNNG